VQYDKEIETFYPSGVSRVRSPIVGEYKKENAGEKNPINKKTPQINKG
jgi:hypothetical protein